MGSSFLYRKLKTSDSYRIENGEDVWQIYICALTTEMAKTKSLKIKRHFSLNTDWSAINLRVVRHFKQTSYFKLSFDNSL